MMRASSVVVLVAAVLLALVPAAFAGMQCHDEQSNPVDWFFIYKMPNSFQFAYRDSNEQRLIPLTVEAGLLNRSNTGALGSTLHQLYSTKGHNDVGWIMWNDEHPYEGPSASMNASSPPNTNAKPYPGGGGHTKGVFAVDSNSGFYLVHSVPSFPDMRFPSFVWNASMIYGQSFLCISLSTIGANDLAAHLQWINPDLFDAQVPSAIAAKYPNLQTLLTGKRSVGTNTYKLSSLGGHLFYAFGKSNTWGGDLYESVVEPTLSVGFVWQTWRRGSEMPSICKPYNSTNILETVVGSYQFSYTRDHSKWGVAVPTAAAMITRGGAAELATVDAATLNYACIGDLNRMTTQRKRGGGTLCVAAQSLHNALLATVKTTQPCTV